ncbi:hypothetical protein MTR_8g080100 [Medicago truncatula]|uniref:Uncharacterized protein n=1 Tax=Medicago truncatula TaxID=3880 RepID=A0A072U3Y4_MEDTR|nr:hypothetical protein MTR_8g080100 [Medicago truncatula]
MECNSSNIVGVIDASEGSDFIDSVELEVENDEKLGSLVNSLRPSLDKGFGINGVFGSGYTSNNYFHGTSWILCCDKSNLRIFKPPIRRNLTHFEVLKLEHNKNGTFLLHTQNQGYAVIILGGGPFLDKNA